MYNYILALSCHVHLYIVRKKIASCYLAVAFIQSDLQYITEMAPLGQIYVSYT